MKVTTLSFICLIWVAITATAQTQKRIYLFEKYTNGVVLLKNKARVSTSLNYDAANRNMMYIDNGNEMILNEAQGVDTVYIGNYKFIPNGQHGFLEKMPVSNGDIFINWALKKQMIGKKGAYGQVIQGNVEVMDLNMIKGQAGVTNREENVTNVYTQQNENEYWLLRAGKFVKCNNEKSLLKLFPGKEEQIKAYIKEQKLDFRNTQQALDIVDYCLGIRM